MIKKDDKIEVLGARVHNLKNIDVEIPRNSFTIITGLSGSRKSSLPKANVVILRRFRLMPVIFWGIWNARMSIK